MDEIDSIDLDECLTDIVTAEAGDLLTIADSGSIMAGGGVPVANAGQYIVANGAGSSGWSNEVTFSNEDGTDSVTVTEIIELKNKIADLEAALKFFTDQLVWSDDKN